MSRAEQQSNANRYKISEVLGPNFVRFAETLKGKDLSHFTFEKIGASNTNTNVNTNVNANRYNSKYNLKDVHYDFTEYLMAVMAAFRQIESPNPLKIEIAGTYADSIYKIYDDLNSKNRRTGGLMQPTLTTFDFKQLPVYEGGSLKYLVPGFNLLGYSKQIYANHTDVSANSFQNAVRYLYHYIALLDLDNLDVNAVMNLLKQDNIVFMEYVYDIVDLLTNSLYYEQQPNLPRQNGSTDIVKNGVLNALTTIAIQIINEFRSIRFPQMSVNAKVDEFLQTDFAKSADDISNALNAKKIPSSKDLMEKFVSLSTPNVYLSGAQANQVVGSDAKSIDVKRYAINGLFNPFYLDINLVSKTINADRIRDLPTQFGGGPKANAANNNDDGKATSLAFLYGPEIPPAPGGQQPPPGQGGLVVQQVAQAQAATTTTRNLITEKLQGNLASIQGFDATWSAAFVDDQKVDNVRRLVTELTITGDVNDNPTKVLYLTLLSYMILNNKPMRDINDVDKAALRTNMQAALRNYTTLMQRLQRIPVDLTDTMTNFRDVFAGEFARSTYKSFNVDPTTKDIGPFVGPRTQSQMTNKFSLADPELWNFYENVVTKNIPFYNEFFNLVKLDDKSDVPLETARTISQSDRANYRLNVRKLLGQTRIRNIQYGGATMYGDIVIIGYIPDYPTNGSVRDIWLSPSVRIPAAVLSQQGLEAVRGIARQIYNAPVGSTSVNIYDVPVDLIDLAARAARTGPFTQNYPGFFSNYLQSLLTDSGYSPVSSWKESELAIDEYMLKEGNNWERRDYGFVRVDKDGNEIPFTQFDDNCNLINESDRECFDFLQQCLGATDKASYETSCGKLLDFNFNFNPPMMTLKETVQKIDPLIAFGILKQFKFGSYMMEEPTHPVKGFRRYKVQSVGSWLEELMTGLPKDRCDRTVAQPSANADFECGPLRDQLGNLAPVIIAAANDPAKRNFFTYLDVLVNWVNANPQILNPEEIVNPNYRGMTKYPDIDKSFQTYSHVNPHMPAQLRVRNLACGLDRLKSTIMNELAGANAPAMLSSMNMPLGIEMPLSRYAFQTPLPFGGIGSQFGGLYEVEREFSNLEQQYGYKMFNDIYKDLLNTMGNLTGNQRIRLTENTTNDVKRKLDNFRKTEDELRKSIIELIEKNKLYQASRGHVNPYVEDNAKYAAIMAKHSNLLEVGGAYNRRAVNIIDLLQTISKAIINKLETGSDPSTGAINTGATGTSSRYYRPMTTGYHYPITKKN